MKHLAPATIASAALLSFVAANACSSSEVSNNPSSAGSTSSPVGQAGSPTLPVGGASQAGSLGSGGTGSLVQAGASSGASPAVGGSAGGVAAGGSAGSVSAAGTSSGGGGLEPGDTPPWRKLNVIAATGEHTHGSAGVDTRAKLLGKLAVDVGVNSGSYSSWLAKRGYHSIGAPCGACAAPNLGAGREAVGTCREGEFANTAASVKATLTSLQQQYSEEDWGYFLNQDGSVRWSDVAITGMSHGATTAAVAARVSVRMWRVVSRSGPRDNGCGKAGGVCTLPLSTPSYDAACAPKDVAAWLDTPSKTPINRFYGLVGTTDVECGDIMFNMQYAKYPGAPVLWNMPGAVLTGTNQFFSTEGGHLDWLQAANVPMNTDEVLNIAFGIPPENQHPNF
jgi:hypothetical protein